MIERGFHCPLELRNNPLGESLAQLNAPLVKGIDLPDYALGEDAMLVERDQLAQCGWRQGVQQQGIRRTITLEQPMWHQPVRRAFRLDLLGGLAESQRLRLREDVGKQHVVMPAQRVHGLGKRDEITGDEPSALMN